MHLILIKTYFVQMYCPGPTWNLANHMGYNQWVNSKKNAGSKENGVD